MFKIINKGQWLNKLYEINFLSDPLIFQWCISFTQVARKLQLQAPGSARLALKGGGWGQTFLSPSCKSWDQLGTAQLQCQPKLAWLHFVQHFGSQCENTLSSPSFGGGQKRRCLLPAQLKLILVLNRVFVLSSPQSFYTEPLNIIPWSHWDKQVRFGIWKWLCSCKCSLCPWYCPRFAAGISTQPDFACHLFWLESGAISWCIFLYLLKVRMVNIWTDDFRGMLKCSLQVLCLLLVIYM